MSWYNPYIFIPLAAWLTAHMIKFLLRALAGDVNLRYFYSSGGMPSGHSATVLALATTALVYDGWSSAVFGISAVFATIVVYDSLGVRRSSGEQAKALAAVLQSLSGKHSTLDSVKIRQVLGHTPAEVIVGMLLGIGVALLMSIAQWS